MKPIRRTTKPGAERAPLRPDSITAFTATEPSQLMALLSAQLPAHKRTAIKQLLKYGQVKLRGTVTSQFDAEVMPGDVVEVNFSRPFVTFRHPRLQLVYEDEHIIVVNKGYGLLSMGNDKVKDGTAYSILRDYVKDVDLHQKIFIVHRLDQHTSGLMVFAKSMQAKEGLQHNWSNMVRRRQYVCVVEGRLDPAEGEVRSFLAENSRHTVYSTSNPQEGKPALTRYRSLKIANGFTLVEVELETGRKNQIRVHMADLGHPISGDRRYGAHTAPIHRLALHARTLVFIHPITRKLMEFETPVPAAFLSMVR